MFGLLVVAFTHVVMYIELRRCETVYTSLPSAQKPSPAFPASCRVSIYSSILRRKKQ